jgi:hypothetical protein
MTTSPHPEGPAERPAPTTPRALRLSSETDVLAFVPYSLGFHPCDSIVMVAICPGRPPMIARADLGCGPDDDRAAATELSRAASANRAEQAILVAYSDDPARALTAVDELADALAEVAVPVVHAFRAHDQRWFTLLPHDATWTVGTPYDLDVHPLTTQSVLEGRVTYADRDCLAASLDPADPDLVDAVAEALDALGALPPPASPGHDRARLREEALWVADWVRERAAHPVEVPRWPATDEAARVLRVLEVREARDVVLAEVTRDTAHGQVQLWRSLARLAPAGHRAQASAMLAFAAWLDGDGALSWCAIDRVREADPDHGLAGLVAGALEGAVPPTVWTPVDRSTLSLLRP